MRLPNKIGFCMCCLSMLLYLAQPMMLSVAVADTNGPPGYTPTPPGYDCDKHGPCTDPHTYTGSGIGNGYCGRCGNKVWTYSGGTCQGTDPGDFNCYEANYPTTITDFFVSTPVGTLAFVACFAGYALCLGGCGILDAGVCGSVCVGTGGFTLGASCIACIAALGGACGAACTCAYDECKESCDYTSSSQAGSTTGCWSS
jgi:hypothetical protein